jgi:DHA1 family quinolone resistance protein-like MFS transporter
MSAEGDRLIRVYTLNRTLHWFITGILFPVMVLLMLAKGLDLFQAGAVVSTYSATIILLELPTGGLSDTIGRKKVYLLSLVANFIGICILVVSWDLLTVAMSFLFIGAARALASGSIDAWFVDEYYRHNGESGLQRAIAKAEMFIAVGIASSSIIGGLLPMTLGPLTEGLEGMDIYSGNLLVILCLIGLQSILTQRLVVEHMDGTKGETAISGLRRLPDTIASSIQYGLRNRIILVLMASMVLLGFGLASVELLWQPKLKDILGGDSDTWIFGLVSAGYFLMGVAGNMVITPLCSRLGDDYAMALFLTRLSLGAMFLVLAVQEGLFGFMTFFLMVFMFNSMETSPHAAILNSEVPKDKRSTILSFESLVLQLGVVAGSLLMGYISNTYDIGTAWSLGAVIVLISSLVFLSPTLRAKGRSFITG